MSYSAPPATTEDAAIINFSQKDVTVIPIGTDINNAVELVKIKLVKEAGFFDSDMPILLVMMLGVGKRTAGAESVRIGFDTSADGISWFRVTDAPNTSAVFDDTFDIIGPNTQLLTPTDPFVRFSLYAGNGTTSGEWKEIKCILKLVLPFGWSIERLL